MKRLELDIGACWHCPYVAWASFTNSESIGKSSFTYCKKKADLNPSSSALSAVQLASDAALLEPNDIPAWCPLPDAEGDRNNG